MWSSLGEVEKASPEKISELVLTGEDVITSEQQAWQSTGSNAGKGKKDKKAKEEK